MEINRVEFYLKEYITPLTVILFLLFSFIYILDYFQLGCDGENLKHSLGDLLQVLAAIFAITIGMLFVAIQISSQLHTIRIVKGYFFNPYFIMMCSLYIGTMIYCVYVLGNIKYMTPFHLNIIFSLFVFDIFYLVPFTILISKEFHPSTSIWFKNLCNKIPTDIKRCIKSDNKMEEQEHPFPLQTIDEIFKRSMEIHDTEISIECIKNLRESYKKVIHDKKTIKLIEPLKSPSALYYGNSFKQFASLAIREHHEIIVYEIIDSLRKMIIEICTICEEYEKDGTLTEEIKSSLKYEIDQVGEEFIKTIKKWINNEKGSADAISRTKIYLTLAIKKYIEKCGFSENFITDTLKWIDEFKN